MSVDRTKMEPLPTATVTSPAVPPTEQSPPIPVQETVPVSTVTAQTQPPPPSVGVRIRPKICDVRDCDSNSLRNPELLFVCVPGHSYPERRFVWLTLMQAARDKKRSYCCSRHFKVPNDFKDFQEFISAPPGYKRQLLVKKGVVPHLNMPPLNMSALPPLTDRWPMTLPAGMTEEERLRQNAATAPPPLRVYQGSQSLQQTTRTSQSVHPNMALVPGTFPRIRCCKGVQTEPTTVSTGPRKVAPSLQYCRLCFQKQDLEPIFTGDQTLIEPDLIDKIFGCTEVMISVERDFPSSICTECYNKVHEYVKFRKLVQLNDQSLRGIPLPSLGTATTSRSASSSFPKQPGFIRTRTTTKIVPNRPTLKVTPLRPVVSSPMSSTQGSPASTAAEQRDDPLLEVQRVENVDRYQRRQETIERNQPQRAQRVQDTLYPVPYRRPITENTAATNDPLASADGEEKASSDSECSSAPEGVQLNDRIVPVTLIRVQSDDEKACEEPQASGKDLPNVEAQDIAVKEEEPDGKIASPQRVNSAVEHSSPKSFIRPKPLLQLMRSAEKSKPNPPNVLQAVKLLPSATAKALANQKSTLKPVNTLTRGITSGRFPVHRIFNTFDRTPKLPMARMISKAQNRVVRFPGLLSTLIHRAEKPQSAPSHSEASSSADSRESPSTTLSKLGHITSSPKAQQNVQVTFSQKPTTSSASPVSKSKVPSIITTRPIPAIVPISSTKLISTLSTTSPIPISNPSKPVLQLKRKEKTELKTSPELNRLAVVVSKLSTSKLSTPSPTSKPKSSKPDPKPAQRDNSPTETSPTPAVPPEPTVPPSPRSSRVRKVPLKFQNSVVFPMPKIITVKPDPDSPKVSQEKPKEPTVRVTRRSNVADENPTGLPTEKKKPEAKETLSKGKTKKDEPPPKKEPTRATRRSDMAITKPVEPDQHAKASKRKSDPRQDTKDHAPPPSKSPKIVDAIKTAKQQSAHDRPKPDQRANGSTKTVTDPVASVAKDPQSPPKSAKPKRRQEPERAKTPVSSKDWKCPFCTDRVFEEKKRLVKHLRKRHGMDYALVRQQLAIYGGNWR